MIVKTRIFELRRGRYRNLSELATAMGISISQIYRVREGKRQINQKFIIGAMKAFPDFKLDDLFYLTPTPDEAAAAGGRKGRGERPALEQVVTGM